MASDIGLGEDVAELKSFLDRAKRPSIRGMLSGQVQKLERKLAAQQKELERRLEKEALSKPVVVTTPANPDLKEPAPPPPKEFAPIRNSAASTPELRYVNLSNLRWDQDGEHVKISVTIDSVEEEVPEEQMLVSFARWSFDVKIHDISGQNYRYGLKKLNKEIVPEMSRAVIKRNKIIITLKKAESDVEWPVLHYKPDPTEEEENRAPMAKLLEMMSHMYDDGDDDMRNTISSAWTTYRDGEDRKRASQMKKRNN